MTRRLHVSLTCSADLLASAAERGVNILESLPAKATIFLVVGLILAGCAQPPRAELSLVAERIEDSASSHFADEFAPITLARAREKLSSAHQKLDSKDYTGAIQDAAEAARLTDDAASLAVKERARTARQTHRTIEDCLAHLELLKHRYESAPKTTEFLAVEQALSELRKSTASPSVLARDSAWKLKRRLIELESTLKPTPRP